MRAFLKPSLSSGVLFEAAAEIIGRFGWLRSVAAFFDSILSVCINGIVSLNTSFIFSYSKIKDCDIEIIAVRS